MEYHFKVDFLTEDYMQCICMEWPTIGLKWLIHRFNDTQEPTMPMPQPIPPGMASNEVEQIMQQMGAYLREYYYDCVF